MNRLEIKKALKDIIETGDFETVKDDFNDCNYKCNYLGSYLSLDPCGKYHHILSLNGVTKRCERFWTNLEECAEELNAWIESGEGNGLDVFLCIAE